MTGECSKMTKMPSSAHFILVHGSCHGAWSWYRIRCLLESVGHEVTCPDLRSSGVDPSDPNSIFTFEEYNKPLDDILTTLPEGKNVILVGHSAGGHSLTEAIHKYPNKIQVAVFVGATMLRNGFITDQDRKDGAPDLSKYGEVYDSTYGEGRDHPPTSVIFKKEIQRQVLYPMCPFEDCTLAAMSLKPCPIRAFIGAKFPGGGEYIDRVPRVYIKTLHDTVFTQEQQDAMIKRWPPSDVFTIDSDHCPIFSNPSHLFGLLLKVANSKFNQ